jgi:hypothetical protein
VGATRHPLPRTSCRTTSEPGLSPTRRSRPPPHALGPARQGARAPLFKAPLVPPFALPRARTLAPATAVANPSRAAVGRRRCSAPAVVFRRRRVRQ